MTRRRGSALVIVLWTLVLMSLLAISGARRVHLVFKMSQYQVDQLTALCLEKSEINRAILVLEKDRVANEYDTLTDSWAQTGSQRTAEIIDEERKINLNTASEHLLWALFQEVGLEFEKAKELSDDLLVWRGSRQASPSLVHYYENERLYSCKGSKLAVLEEIFLVKGFDDVGENVLERIRDVSTLEGNGKININTVSKEVLRILAVAAISELKGLPADPPIGEAAIQGFLESILSDRDQGGFVSPEQLNLDGFKQKFGFKDVSEDPRSRIAERLLSEGMMTTRSQNFRISVKGQTTLYDRSTKKSRPF